MIAICTIVKCMRTQGAASLGSLVRHVLAITSFDSVMPQGIYLLARRFPRLNGASQPIECVPDRPKYDHGGRDDQRLALRRKPSRQRHAAHRTEKPPRGPPRRAPICVSYCSYEFHAATLARSWIPECDVRDLRIVVALLPVHLSANGTQDF